jgi:hypothetical protein
MKLRAPTSFLGQGQVWTKLAQALRLGAYSRVRKLRTADAEQRAPLLVIVGSISDCSYKDALSYARGLAQQQVLAGETSWIRVVPDPENGRFLYEIHDGGEGRALLPRIKRELEATHELKMRLANGALASVQASEDGASIFTLIFADALEIEQQHAEGEPPLRIEDVPYAYTFASELRMQELFPQNYKLAAAGGALLSVGLGLAALSGIVWLTQSLKILPEPGVPLVLANVQNTVRNNPLLHLQEAQRAVPSGQHIARLQFAAGTWSHVFADDAAPAPQGHYHAGDKPSVAVPARGGAHPPALSSSTPPVPAHAVAPGLNQEPQPRREPAPAPAVPQVQPSVAGGPTLGAPIQAARVTPRGLPDDVLGGAAPHPTHLPSNLPPGAHPSTGAPQQGLK